MFNSHSYTTFNSDNYRSTLSRPLSVRDLTHLIRDRHGDALDRLDSVIHHPRSLARSGAGWRPPVKSLPRVDGSSHLVAAITRRRVGPLARARIKGYGETDIPAYLLEIRFTDPSGRAIDRDVAEAWVRGLVPENMAGAVHELESVNAATFVWLVDRNYYPIYSPPSMFENLAAA
ncbi:hypothetical protein [Corynebacterium aquatimens]|uniref:Uncharacterized protein n=1 Tax=Corynebacterium aquatimens TaxID=1190508 RepID=A0A931DW44_9CORY|nr:hypothetical protein [Corynebacterium aquatimens]MBG6121307.1 hypothetical protein [Corynebacterium aquatimens]